MMRRIAVLDAPSNLGLRPPTPTSVPGCAKAPGALRDHDLLARLGARDAGCLTPPRYDPGDWRPGDGVCHARSIAAYSQSLADRIGTIIDQGEFPVVLGGDCSILLGGALAMHRLGEAVGGRIGLVFVDGHSDFRHPGNASYVGAAAGEDLALVTGRGQADLTAIEGRRPYFRDIDVVVLGIRAQDEYRLDLQAAGIVTRPVPLLRTEGAARSAQWAHEQLADCAGYWVHVDVDVLDPAVMPAVDAPDAGGIAFPELELLLAGLVDTPHCLGVEVTVFDPDYDPDGGYAAEIVSTLVTGLAPVHAPAPVAAGGAAERPPDPAAPGVPGRPASPSRPVPAGSRPIGGGLGSGPEPLSGPASITVPERLARRRRPAPGHLGPRPGSTGREERTEAGGGPNGLPEDATDGPAKLRTGAVATPAGTGAGATSGDGALDGRIPQGRVPEDRAPQGRLPEDRAPLGRLPEDRPWDGRFPAGGQVEPVGPPAAAGPGRLRRNPVDSRHPAEEPGSGPGPARPADNAGSAGALGGGPETDTGTEIA